MAHSCPKRCMHSEKNVAEIIQNYHLTDDRPQTSWATSLANDKREFVERGMSHVEKTWYPCNQPQRPLVRADDDRLEYRK